MMETYERFDMVADRAKGMYVYDENGVAYLDFMPALLLTA